ncbi:extracellular solute-binding protein [Haloferax mediterranei ATCC 33500]|uniref:ABC-type iron(III) transport system,substrate-binding protein n=1 Tax=Haloferax mediterranei (strain ATCC 33500 / DSM 1411 / JCM 8866 / NBRC 14739 / NCIMB 2177 / R-4) TaxID=523841 RepID=I3R5I9_HALMT|nr:iron ABC transporter substrate-binding protein [Haloferax mediterranei]AFK19499.1 ABC-type iron(III) transport system,substrate-binding protein [Haloferax mediterranei ATCC 33500]AHZ21159.1 iron ABC transporter substrate-binding protein [Haloferax mediterranei ATCC 33500]EMA04313.1 ABC-type iron(III) transport system,substrate-binding protein [Haloferax mediterranei ATCC 33500]MDX5989602.1 extracellular solute-binding protein [Haloferax mediterranei ATCC 33500]QCQ75958.1 extracellular solut
MQDHDRELRGHGRRRFIATAAALGLGSLAGCAGLGGEDETTTESGGNETVEQIGSGRSPFGDREITGGVSVADMPDLSGELTLYSGRGEALVGELISFFEDYYDDFTIRPRYNSAAELVNQIQTEGQNSPADVFFSVNAGSLGALKDAGRTQKLPSEVLDLVRDEFHDPDGQWTGTSGRARTVPFNTDQFDESEIPDDIMKFPETEAFRDNIGWAPTYSSFQAFITAMRVLEGEEATKQWLQGMQDLGVTEFKDEFLVSQAVADGEISAGFANHYYIQRILAGRPNAPLKTAFTSGDAGSIFNVAGALVLNTADDADLASNFVRHLLSAEAQDYFARTTFEYPLVSGVDPIGELPSIDELNPPEGLDLTQLSDLEGTVRLLREVGVL